jgi:hypothetical protein
MAVEMLRMVIALSVISLCGGCGTNIPSQVEVWDRGNPQAVEEMQKQIKYSIYCELRDAVRSVRGGPKTVRYRDGKVVGGQNEISLPDTWGAQITMSFTVDETGKFNPGITSTYPIQDFAISLGANLSSQAMRIEKFETFYTVPELAYTYSDREVCKERPDFDLGRQSSSSPMTVLSELGIREWLPKAYNVSNFLRSSRAKDRVGSPLGASGFASDGFSYNIKFVIVAEGSVNPVWKLVRITTSESPALFIANRTKTHELLITIGPGDFGPVDGPSSSRAMVGLARGPAASNLALQIGSAVSNAIQSKADR